MNCEPTQVWLLQAEILQPADWPLEVARHVNACAACTKMADDLRQLEDAWNHQPLPAECQRGKTAFLQHLASLPSDSKTSRRRWVPRRWVAAAAVLLFSAGVLTWMLYPAQTQASSSSDLVERLVDWNLALTNADAAERQRLHKEQEEKFRAELAKEELSEDDRALAEELLDNGLKMTTQADPLAEAERFNKLTDNLVAQMDKPEKKNNSKEMERRLLVCSKLREWGVKFNMERVVLNKKLYEAKKGNFEHLANDDQQHQQKLEKMVERSPERNRANLRKLLEAWRKLPHHHPGHMHKK